MKNEGKKGNEKRKKKEIGVRHAWHVMRGTSCVGGVVVGSEGKIQRYFYPTKP